MKKEKHTICYSASEHTSHGYTIATVYVRLCDLDSIDHLLAGTVDNRAGYQTDAIASEVQRKYAALRDRGVKRVVGYMYDTTFEAHFQVYREATDGEPRQYCTVGFEHIGYRIGPIDNALKLIRKLAKRAARLAGRDHVSECEPFTSPGQLIAALEDAGAVEICPTADTRFNTAWDWAPRSELKDPPEASWSEPAAIRH